MVGQGEVFRLHLSQRTGQGRGLLCQDTPSPNNLKSCHVRRCPGGRTDIRSPWRAAQYSARCGEQRRGIFGYRTRSAPNIGGGVIALRTIGEERRAGCFGVSVLSRLRTSACARRSRGPEQKTLRREFTSVGRTNVASLNGGSPDGAAPGESCGRSGRAAAGRETAADSAVSFRGNSLLPLRPVLTSPCPETTPSPSCRWRRWPGVCRRG